MDARTFIDDMYASAKKLTTQGRDMAEQQLGIPASGDSRDAMLDGMGKGALAAGALALLLGTGAGRRLTGSALKLGGLAAVGAVAYKAYQNWQAQQDSIPAGDATPVGELPNAQAQARSAVLLEAMVLAARADGHIDAQERVRIEQQLRQLGLDGDIEGLIPDALAEPLDVVALASKVDSTEAAAEVYLVSRLIMDPGNDAEWAHLDALASALQLDPALRDQLEGEVESTS